MSSLGDLQQQVIDELPRSFGASELTTEYLGRRLALCVSHPAAFEGLRVELHRRLLDSTVRVCREHSPFFRKRFADIDLEAVLRDGAVALPLTSRSDMETEQRELCLDNVDFELCCFTSGSTTGRSLTTYFSRQEYAFLREIFPLLIVAQEAPAADDIVLDLARTNPHGQGLQVRSDPRRHIVTPFENDLDYDQVERVLATTFWSNGRSAWITSIHAPSYDILRLTGLLSKHGRSDIAARITEVEFTGRMLSRRERRLLSTFWSCPIGDVFSMSEAPSFCLYCELCGAYHFDPISQYEVLDAESFKPLTEGRGRLAVTGLYPFKQMTPLIRYLNGDVVDVWRSDCPLGPRTFRPLGRFSRSATLRLASGSHYIVTPGEVLDILDEIPDVVRNTVPGLGAATDAEWGWTPRFLLRADAGTVHLRSELRFEPKAYPERAAEISAAIAAELRKSSRILADALGEKALTIDLVGPGELTEDAAIVRSSIKRNSYLHHDPIGI